jgi:diguanylate cyclase (GGDEF)-like protein
VPDPAVLESLTVLLERFAARCDAVSARLVGFDDGARPETWSTLEREGVVDDARRWEDAAAFVMDDPRVRLGFEGANSPPVSLCIPVEVRGDIRAVLCGGFAAETLTNATSVLWAGAAFAHTMALCVDDPPGLSQMVGASAIDPLTGCKNAAAMWNDLEREISRAGRQRTPLVCVFVDLDDFNQVNEDDGDLGGDVVLAAVGAALASCVRGYDTLARFNGDDFVVLLPNSTEKQARSLVERMSKDVIAATAPLVATPISTSFGTAQWRFEETAAALVERARGETV